MSMEEYSPILENNLNKLKNAMKKILLILAAGLILSGCNGNRMQITVKNSLAGDRAAETVEILAADITGVISGADLSKLIVTDKKGTEIPSQVIFEGGTDPVSLIFQPVVAGNSESVYYITQGTPQKYEPRAYGRFVPERMDDYAWENDHIAFRIYGTALIAKDGPSNGLDVWVKRTGKMVIDRWYGDYLAGKSSYHDDNGEGCDCFKVGRTLGAGAMAPYLNDSLWLAINFEDHQTLDNGPLRTSFRLKYPPFMVNGILVTETRTISLDAGSQLTSITEEYTGMESAFPVAAGIVKRDEGMPLASSADEGTITYRLDGGVSGITYLGTVLKTPAKSIVDTRDHVLIVTTYAPGTSLTYFTGAGWSKWGFETDSSWTQYIKDFSLRQRNPLQVSIGR